MRTTKRDEAFRLVMTPTEKTVLWALAEREDRSQAALLRLLLRTEAEKRGLWPMPIPPARPATEVRP